MLFLRTSLQFPLMRKTLHIHPRNYYYRPKNDTFLPLLRQKIQIFVVFDVFLTTSTKWTLTFSKLKKLMQVSMAYGRPPMRIVPSKLYFYRETERMLELQKALYILQPLVNNPGNFWTSHEEPYILCNQSANSTQKFPKNHE